MAIHCQGKLTQNPCIHDYPIVTNTKYLAPTTVSFYSTATREDGSLFSSFVNTIVMATIYAQENNDKETSREMPLMSVFGSEFSWALRDAISYSGSYDEIYRKYFGDVAEENRGRNTLNNKGGPQLHSLPGLSQHDNETV